VDRGVVDEAIPWSIEDLSALRLLEKGAQEMERGRVRERETK